MANKRSVLYRLLEGVHDIVNLPIWTWNSPLMWDIRFELTDSDISSVEIKDNKCLLTLTKDGLKKVIIKTKYYNKRTKITLEYLADNDDILRLAIVDNIKDLLYDDKLIWSFKNSDDKNIQRETLKKFIK